MTTDLRPLRSLLRPGHGFVFLPEEDGWEINNTLGYQGISLILQAVDDINVLALIIRNVTGVCLGSKPAMFPAIHIERFKPWKCLYKPRLI